MNEHVALSNAVVTSSPWFEASEKVNLWRGNCLNQFAKVEAAATQALQALASINATDNKIKIRQLSGQRYAALYSAIQPGGPNEALGKSCFKTLSEFLEFEDFRVFLAHGVAKIALERNGQWVAIFAHWPVQSGIAVEQKRAFDQDEAERLRKELSSVSQQLCARLGNLTKACSDQSKAKKSTNSKVLTTQSAPAPAQPEMHSPG